MFTQKPFSNHTPDISSAQRGIRKYTYKTQLDGKIFCRNHNIESGSNSILKIEGVLCNITCLEPFSDDICIAKGKLRTRLCKDEGKKSVHLRHNWVWYHQHNKDIYILR